MSMATVMSQMPDVWRRALAEHVPDGARHCRACCSPTGVQASWPCQTFKVADEARLLAEGYLPVPSAPAPREPVSGSHRSYDAGDTAGRYDADRWTDTPHWADTPPSWSDSWSSAPSAERYGERSWDREPSWAAESRTPVTRGREIADLPVDPRESDPWERVHRHRANDRRPWSYGASFGADPWSR